MQRRASLVVDAMAKVLSEEYSIPTTNPLFWKVMNFATESGFDSIYENFGNALKFAKEVIEISGGKV